MKTSGRRRKKASCRTLRRKARRIDNRRKRKAALRQLPQRCKPVEGRRPTPSTGPSTTVPAGTQPVTPWVAPPAPGTPDPTPPDPAPAGSIESPLAIYSGTFGPRQAERLLWRAGFGPRPGQAAQLAALGVEAAVLSLSRPSGTPVMDGPAPKDEGSALDPYGTWGHDHLWWLDRMVRSRHQLVERMTLIWHDWFSTSDAGVGSTKFMFDQNNLFRSLGLGNFKALVRAVTLDPAMQIWLSALENRRGAINENYGRELMELFTLGADRGAYTEADVRELARALSGFDADWEDGVGFVNFRFNAQRFDAGAKTIFGATGNFNWNDACRLVTGHSLHASFFVSKLWSYFVAEAPTEATSTALEKLYVDSGGEIRPIVEAILCSPQFYDGAAMVKPPVVYNAGLLRATGQGITTNAWSWMGSQAGQKLFYPPDVSGWDDTRWLDTNTMAGRWEIANLALELGSIQPSEAFPAQTAAQAVETARASLNDPALTADTKSALDAWAADVVGAAPDPWERAQRYNALRQLIAMSPDHHTS
jgi:hypothetical protein